MSINKTAYVYDIDPNATGDDEVGLVHQTSPAWVLTFLRWAIRDTLRTQNSSTLNWSTIVADATTGQPLVVENDCIQLGVADSKSVLTQTMTATLKMTDVNYETEIAPGDFVFVNMLNWEKDARRVANQARALQPINGVNDGFKGFFKVQRVGKTLRVDPESGIKILVIDISAFAFTEFNNSVYFNPALINGSSDQNLGVYLTNIGADWDLIQSASSKGTNSIQTIVQFLIDSLIGVGFPDDTRKTNITSPLSPNVHFYMPNNVDKLLGLPLATSAKDTFNYLFGIQQYSPKAQTLALGMNPSNIASGTTPNGTPQDSRFILLQTPVEGTSCIKPAYWNNVKTWAILNQFTNSPLNEMYTCFRVAPTGKVLPTVVFRQIPFTTDGFQTSDGVNVTKFMSLPRWNISPALALNYNLGRDEALRLNFIQYYGIPSNYPAGAQAAQSAQTAMGNYLYDLDDVKRSGLRPSVITSEFDFLNGNGGYKAPGWAKIVGDALMGGHLKMSGNIEFVGIPEPIAVGDNLQFDNTVYHIEQISHNAFIQPQTGKKVFRTTIHVSYGMDISNGNNVRYSEMLYGSAYDKRDADYDSTDILPGVSESQNTYYRKANPDQPVSDGQSFIQPNTNTSITKTTRDS